jgi:hypothetical protein
MPNVYVEPRPKGRPDGTPIVDYVLETDGSRPVDGKSYGTPGGSHRRGEGARASTPGVARQAHGQRQSRSFAAKS